MKNLIFPIAIEPGDAHHAFGVVVPDIPGCHSAGDSLEEAYANAKEAIEAHLDTLLDEGMPMPERLTLDAASAQSGLCGLYVGLRHNAQHSRVEESRPHQYLSA